MDSSPHQLGCRVCWILIRKIANIYGRRRLASVLIQPSTLPAAADFINIEQPTGSRETWLQFNSSRKMLHLLRSCNQIILRRMQPSMRNCCFAPHTMPNSSSRRVLSALSMHFFFDARCRCNHVPRLFLSPVWDLGTLQFPSRDSYTFPVEHTTCLPTALSADPRRSQSFQAGVPCLHLSHPSSLTCVAVVPMLQG
jgi:hypothetical protein